MLCVSLLLAAPPLLASETAPAVQPTPTQEFVDALRKGVAGQARSWVALGLLGSGVLLAAVTLGLQAPATGELYPRATPGWVVPSIQVALWTVAAGLGVAGAVVFLWPTELMEKLAGRTP
jgi:hypothetical protein